MCIVHKQVVTADPATYPYGIGMLTHHHVCN